MKKFKKYHHTICFLIVCVTFATLLLTVPVAKADRTKKIENRIPVKPDQGVVLASFQYSDLIIKYHDKPEVLYSLTVTVSSDDEDDEIELIDSIYINDKISSNEIMVQMVDHAPQNSQSDIKILGISFSEGFKKSVRGEVLIPACRWTNIGLRYSRATVDDISSEMKIAGSNNTISVKRCKNIRSISNQYGTTKLYDCAGNGMTVEGKSGSYAFYSIKGNLSLDVPYSTVEANDIIGKLSVEARSSKVKCKNVSEEVKCNADYAEISIEKVKKNMNISCRSGTVNLSEISNVRIDANYSTINIRKVNVSDTSRGIEIINRSGTVRLDEVNAKVDIDAPYSTIGLRDITGNVAFIGRSSKVSGLRISGNIDISAEYGTLELREIRSKIIRCETENGGIRLNISQLPEKVMLYAPKGNVSITVPRNFDGALHLNSSSEIDSNLECLSGSASTRKFEGKQRTGKGSDISVRAGTLRFYEN